MINTEFKIEEHLIKTGAQPYVIAEAGSNHNQSLDTALKLIDVAAVAGAHAVKFQLFVAEKMYPKGTKMYDVFKSIEFNQDWLPKLVHHSQSLGIAFMASAFDNESVDLLDGVGIPAFKVASSEVVNSRLMGHIASKKKPVIISTGMCDLVDVLAAVEQCEQLGISSVSLLQCGSVYPLPSEQVNLRVMDAFSSIFHCPVGFSDHTLGLAASIAAAARGACIIEKHFTLDKESEGPDHFYALNPTELSQMIKMIREVHNALGNSEKYMLPQEKEMGRRDGIYLKNNLAAGIILQNNDIETKRPALGLRSRHLDKVIGSCLKKNLTAGTPLQWEHLSFSENHSS